MCFRALKMWWSFCRTQKHTIQTFVGLDGDEQLVTEAEGTNSTAENILDAPDRSSFGLALTSEPVKVRGSGPILLVAGDSGMGLKKGKSNYAEFVEAATGAHHAIKMSNKNSKEICEAALRYIEAVSEGYLDAESLVGLPPETTWGDVHLHGMMKGSGAEAHQDQSATAGDKTVERTPRRQVVVLLVLFGNELIAGSWRLKPRHVCERSMNDLLEGVASIFSHPAVVGGKVVYGCGPWPGLQKWGNVSPDRW